MGHSIAKYSDIDILDNQWPVNFNLPLSSFEPHISGVGNLIHLAAASTHDPFILFVSSVSSVGSWQHPDGISETIVHNFSAAASIGYAQSKLIAECLLDEASKISGIRSACCRVGIVAGPVEKQPGMWNMHEYIPSVRYLGCIL